MRITLEIPDTVAHDLEAKWGNLEQKMLELLVIEAYRSVLIGKGQVKRLLKLLEKKCPKSLNPLG